VEGQLKMRGFASEVLILSGVFLNSTSFGLSITLLVLGILGAIFRIGIEINKNQKKEMFFNAAGNFIEKVAAAAEHIDPMQHFNSKNVH